MKSRHLLICISIHPLGSILSRTAFGSNNATSHSLLGSVSRYQLCISESRYFCNFLAKLCKAPFLVRGSNKQRFQTYLPTLMEYQQHYPAETYNTGTSAENLVLNNNSHI